MAATSTRKSITEFKKHLKDEDYTIIPNELFAALIQENARNQDLLVASLQSIDKSAATTAVALQNLADTMERMNASTTTHTNAIVTKMDELIEKLGTVNSLTSMTGVPTTAVITDKELDTMATKRCETETQQQRAKDLVELYTELLVKDPPFAPAKYH